MRKVFKSIDEIFTSDVISTLRKSKNAGLDRILKSTKLEDIIYSELREEDTTMDCIEAECSAKLPTFQSLSRDIYQSFYSLSIRRNKEDELSDTVKRFNGHILNEIMNGEDYPTIKSVCEGRQMPAYDATSEFITNISDGLDDLLKDAGGDKGALNTLEKLNQQKQNLCTSLNELLQNREKDGATSETDKKIIDKANAVFNKSQQVEAVSQQVQDNLLKNRKKISEVIANAACLAKQKAEDTAMSIAVWGQGEENSTPERLKLNKEILDRVRKSPVLKEVTKFLGRFKEISAKLRKNGYAYGRGEKYTLELGNDIQRVITSELTMLTLPETIPLFLRKYQNKSLRQYKRREAVCKGSGDIIICIDESSSARDEAPWGKAVALSLLNAAMEGSRKFAIIHFSSKGKYKTDVFIPGEYDISDVFATAETFLNGNTDFETPIREAYRLIKDSNFENADMVFVTDGECELPRDIEIELKEWQQTYKFTITGVLLDISSPGMDFSLKPFCDEILRTSELSQDNIIEELLSKRS